MSDLPTRIREHAKRVVGVLVEQDLNRAANEIERLREELAERDNRIEGFENRTLMEKVDDICEGISDTHIITTDQIRAAWKWWTAYGSSDVLRIFEELNIVRCEGCGGDGHSMSTFAVKHEQVRMGTCPGCNGEGWKIGGGDE